MALNCSTCGGSGRICSERVEGYGDNKYLTNKDHGPCLACGGKGYPTCENCDEPATIMNQNEYLCDDCDRLF